MRVVVPQGERMGRFETVDARGRLILRLQDGSIETVTAGDVSTFSAERCVAVAERR